MLEISGAKKEFLLNHEFLMNIMDNINNNKKDGQAAYKIK